MHYSLISVFLLSLDGDWVDAEEALHPRPSATPASGGQCAFDQVFEFHLYILIISIKYYFMFIVLKMNVLIFCIKNSQRVKYRFELMCN